MSVNFQREMADIVAEYEKFSRRWNTANKFINCDGGISPRRECSVAQRCMKRMQREDHNFIRWCRAALKGRQWIHPIREFVFPHPERYEKDFGKSWHYSETNHISDSSNISSSMRFSFSRSLCWHRCLVAVRSYRLNLHFCIRKDPCTRFVNSFRIISLAPVNPSTFRLSHQLNEHTASKATMILHAILYSFIYTASTVGHVAFKEGFGACMGHKCQFWEWLGHFNSYELNRISYGGVL